ncbi:MAG TPA: DUF167 domain-containing protein [Candidatus Baltobacteraceae bacterium]|nr:DUF167 domain-containing protein [Candidatus Baltobacteraceae bacterium]
MLSSSIQSGFPVATIVVRVTPGARSPSLSRLGNTVEIRVVAPALEGRATEAARKALANALGIPQSRVTLARGARSREKAFDVAGVERAEAFAKIDAARRDPRSNGRKPAS